MQLSKKTIFSAACAAALLLAGGAQAAQTATLTITGNVLAECNFTSGNYAMPFGTLSPSSTVDATKTVTLAYQCTNGTAASSIKIGGQNSVANVTITNGTSTLPVHLSWPAPTGTGSGIGTAFGFLTTDVTGTILASDIASAMAGTYTAVYNIDLLP